MRNTDSLPDVLDLHMRSLSRRQFPTQRNVMHAAVMQLRSDAEELARLRIENATLHEELARTRTRIALITAELSFAKREAHALPTS